MKGPLEIITGLGASATSIIDAIHFFSHDEPEVSQTEYETRLGEIIGLDQPLECASWYMARIMFLYVVQETIRVCQDGAIPNMEDVLILAREKATNYRANNPWSETRFNIEHGLRPDTMDELSCDNENESYQRKGAKKERSERLFKDLKASGASRQEIIDTFIEDIGMSRAGATTYFHALKKELGFRESEKEQKADKPESKQEQAERLYQDSPDKSKPVMVELLMEKLGTSKLGAQTYYYACKKKYGKAS